MAGPGGRRAGKPSGPSRLPTKSAEAGSGPDGPPSSGFSGGGWGHPQGGQWSQSQWGKGPPPGPPQGPPPGWQGSGPPMHPPPGYGNPSLGGYSPPRPSQGRPRGSPDMMGGYPGGPPMCHPADSIDMEMYHSRGVGPGGDDDNSADGGSHMKDKGRGSYKCGRVSVSKLFCATYISWSV
jgi:hypothetical protein